MKKVNSLSTKHWRTPLPSNNLLVAALSASLLMAGCASYCELETFSKLEPTNQVAGVKSHTDGSRHVVLKFAADAKIDVSSCFSNGLCLEVDLPEKKRMQFASNEFLELDISGTGASRTHYIDRVYFTVKCEETRKIPRVCSSSELSPTSQPVDVKAYPKVKHNDREFQLFWKSFDSRLEFIGTKETAGSLIHRSQNRKYEMRILTDRKPNTPSYLIRLPAVFIDGQSYILPDIRVSNVREEVCKTPSK